LAKVAKTTHENLISVGAIITTIAESLGHSGKIHTPELHFLGRSVDISTLAHMSILDTRGGTIKYPHHKQILFTFPVVARTTIANKKNWNCDRVVIRERVWPPEQEEEEVHDEGEFEEADEGAAGDEEGQDAPPPGGPHSDPGPPPLP